MGKKKKQEKRKEKEEKLVKASKGKKKEKTEEKTEKKAEKKAKDRKAEKPEKPLKENKRTVKPEQAVRLEEGMKPEKSVKLERSVKPDNPAAGLDGDSDAVTDQKLAEIFKAIGDETRIQILSLLEGREVCAGDLLKSLSIVQSTLSHHMKILVESGIVVCRREGKRSWYSIDGKMLAKVSVYIMKWS